MRRTGLFLTMLLVAVANITLLAGVWYNRTGPPDALITLTERELRLVHAEEGDSGVALRISFRGTQLSNEGTWLDRAKLEALGFDYPEGDIGHNLNVIRSVLVVLELGEADEQASAMASRLSAVDAGLDAGELRRRYGDRSRYIIAPGIARLYLGRDDEDDDKEEEKLEASVQRLLTPIIHVPKRYSAFLAGLEAERPQSPRYAVTLRYGRRLEPWVVKVEPLEPQPSP